MNGSVHIEVADTLQPGVCSRKLTSTLNKQNNDLVARVSLAAMLAGKPVKVAYETSNCELVWIEVRD